jgi:CheY-like chemotaxis protein
LSLIGNLEDLPLLDILQIVSFSKKTGCLGIRTDAGPGAIVFKDGLVVAAFTWETPTIDPRVRAASAEKRKTVIRSRIELALNKLIRLREGRFHFALSLEPPVSVEERDLSDETLEAGINAEELILDLARGIDEDRRNSAAALEASFAEAEEAPAEEPGGETEPDEPTGLVEATVDEALGGRGGGDEIAPGTTLASEAPAVSEKEQATGPTVVLLVDDEEDVRRVLADSLESAGYQVVEAEDTNAAVKKAQRLAGAEIPFLLVTDLGMPTSGGSSFQGGFEVVKRIRKMNLDPPVLVMTESLSSAVQARSKQMKISDLVFKPSLSKLDPAHFESDLKGFARRLLNESIPRMGPPRGKVGRLQPAAKVEAPRPAEDSRSAEDAAQEFASLQRRLTELRRPQDASEVAQLVMKVAREFFERGMLLLVRNDEARGLGGFGAAPKGESLNLVVRQLVIPLGEPSVFRSLVSARKPFRGRIEEDKWGRYLLAKIGRFRASEAALLPLLTHREVVAVLYGDNPETGRDLGALEGLEVFISQAGIALENAFLQRKIQALEARAGATA